MNNLNKFYLKTIKYDFVNKFLFRNTKSVSRIKKISLNFGCKSNNFSKLSTSLLALELIVNQRGKLTNTSQPNVLLKVRKRDPVGCKVTLRKMQIFSFLNEAITNTFPHMKNFEGLKILVKTNNTLSYDIKETLSFRKLEENYYLFHNLPKLNITIVSTCKDERQLLFFLNSIKIPFAKS